MAAMDQTKLTNMCNSLNNSANDYVAQVKNSAVELANKFNENWVSNNSRKLASEITECLNSLADAVTNTFSDKNRNIADAVARFNAVEDESISYAGFTFGKPDTTISVGATLPNGKVGVADGADLSSINVPMKTMVEKVNAVMDDIVSKVNSADALDMAEQEALTYSVQRIKAHFDTEMNELAQSLESRMSGEIMERDNKTLQSVDELRS